MNSLHDCSRFLPGIFFAIFVMVSPSVAQVEEDTVRAVRDNSVVAMVTDNVQYPNIEMGLSERDDANPVRILQQMDAEARRLAELVLQSEGDERHCLEEELDTILGNIFSHTPLMRQGNIEDLSMRVEGWGEKLALCRKDKQMYITCRRRLLLGVSPVHDH